LTGPFATLASTADALEQGALPAARDLGALTQSADLDRLEAERAVVAENLTSLIAELRQPPPDGPEQSLATNLIARLLQDIDDLGVTAGVLDTSVSPPAIGANAVTPADFANVSRFEVLRDWVTATQTAVAAFNFVVVDARATIALVKELLGVITEKTRELELELDAADFGPAERARFQVPNAAGDDITAARLLEWLQDQAGRQLPRLLDTAGRLAGDTVVATLTEQQEFLESLRANPDFPWAYPIVDRLLDDLVRAPGSPPDRGGFVQQAIAEAGTL
jgi:hypothetical protein